MVAAEVPKLSRVYERVAQSRLLTRLFLRVLRINSTLTVAYLVMNDVSLTRQVVRYYSSLGVRIQLFVDLKSRPECVRDLSRLGVPVQLVANDDDYVEGMYAEVADSASTGWLLIMTSDELLNTRALLSIARLARRRDTADVVGLPRRWLMSRNGRLLRSTASLVGMDYQWRMIRKGAVEYHGRLHTPGYALPDYVQILSSDECIYHFDWVVRDYASRRRKLEHYEQLEEGLWEKYEQWYLPEDWLHLHEFSELEIAEPLAVLWPEIDVA